MSEKVLSISIASYNVEQYIENTIASLIANQEVLKKLEIIIVNDGSKDNTSALANNLKNKYPESIIVVDKENGGYGSTINASLQIASGKYYKLLDGDDWFEKDTLNRFVSFLDSAESDIVLSSYYECYETTGERKINDSHREIGRAPAEISEIKVTDLYFAMHEIAIRTECLRSIGRPIEEHCFYTDAEYVCYCLTAANTISRFEEPVYCYRLGVEGQSVSLSGMRKHYKETPKVAKKIFACYEQYADKFISEKSEILKYCVKNISYNTYRTYLLLENPLSYRKELMAFDREIKTSYPKSYSLSGESKLIKLLRTFRFRPYSLICKTVMDKFRKETSY